MTSIRLKFRLSGTQEKEGSLHFQVIHHRTVRTIATDCRIHLNEWNEHTSFIRITGSPERQAQLQLMASRLRWNTRQLTDIIKEKELSRIEYTTDDIVTAYRLLPSNQTWFCFIRSMIALKTKVGRLGTAKTYRDALASFTHFREGEDIAIDVLDAELISQYEAWLKGRGLKRNSSSCYLRTLRTLYRKAVEKGLTRNQDIFRHVFTGFASTAKRAIPMESVRSISRLQLTEGTPLAFARDMFLLSLYLQGMSFVDMAYLRKSDLHNGILQYNRKKTGQSLTISWEPPMQDIVEEYADQTADSPYLLPIITRQDGTEREQYNRMEHKINRYLKKIGVMAGLQIPLTTYVSRHTWASTMRDIGCDLSVISRGLGHESLKTTQIYLSTIDTTTVAEANRKMIGLIQE